MVSKVAIYHFFLRFSVNRPNNFSKSLRVDKRFKSKLECIAIRNIRVCISILNCTSTRNMNEKVRNGLRCAFFFVGRYLVYSELFSDDSNLSSHFFTLELENHFDLRSSRRVKKFLQKPAILVLDN